MSPELDAELCKKYPKIFVNRNQDSSESCMSWGFECGDGWYDLLDTLCFTIQNWIDCNSRRNISQVTADQVKEKFGTLRFYYTGGDDLISGMVELAENISGKTCEQCGQKGKRVGSGWITTLCKQHAEERNIYESEEE